MKLARVNVVILDGITGSKQLYLFESRNPSNKFFLNLFGHAGRDAIRINLVGLVAFRFKKNLMARLLAELDHLVFDRWTVARSYPLDVTAVERRLVEVSADYVMNLFIGVPDEALDLGPIDRTSLEGERYRFVVTRLPLEL